MADGWIKLYRTIWENPVVTKDSDHLAVWIYILTEATHKGVPKLFKGEKIELQPGQLITGRKKISAVTRVDEYKVQRILKVFENEQQIAQQISNKNRLISILNWDKYQVNAQQNEQQLHNNCTTTAQQLHTNKNVKKEKNFKNERIIDPLDEQRERLNIQKIMNQMKQ